LKKSSKLGTISWLGLVFWLGICFIAAWIGSQFPPDEWYNRLIKPVLTPPGWILGPVWTMLYAMMGVAAWLVWEKRQNDKVTISLWLFILQLGLNSLWSYLFFGLKSPGLALLDILALWVAILASLISFFRHQRTAGKLLIPYLLWVSFAVYLNLQFWRLTP
jgi:translocator protein